MEPESLDTAKEVEKINQGLGRQFGYIGDKVLWRVVWSETQFEHRYGTYNHFDRNNNFVSSTTGVLEVPKYRQWIQEKYVLERLLDVSGLDRKELTTDWSYEPIFVFEDKDGSFLPPRLDVAILVINQIYHNAAHMVGAKYKEEISEEITEARIAAIEEELFGNESSVTDALRFGSGIVVPSGYEREKN